MTKNEAIKQSLIKFKDEISIFLQSDENRITLVSIGPSSDITYVGSTNIFGERALITFEVDKRDIENIMAIEKRQQRIKSVTTSWLFKLTEYETKNKLETISKFITLVTLGVIGMMLIMTLIYYIVTYILYIVSVSLLWINGYKEIVSNIILIGLFTIIVNYLLIVYIREKR